MPRNTRQTLAHAVEARCFWCIHCMRTQYKGYAQTAAAPLDIVCVLDAKASIMCKQCAGRNQTCELVSSTSVRWAFANVSWTATGVLGDTYDLSALLR